MKMSRTFLSISFIAIISTLAHGQYGEVFNYSNNTTESHGVVGLIDQNGNHLSIINANSTAYIQYSDPQFNSIWCKTLDVYFAGTNGDVIQLSSGDFVISVHQSSDSRAHLFKLDQNGNLIWYKIIDQSASTIDNLIEGDNNSVIITLSYAGEKELVKFDENGGIVWQKQFEYAGFNNTIPNLITSADGNMLYGMSMYASGELPRFSLMKVDMNGSLIWEKNYRMYAGSEAYRNLYEDSSGNIYLVGYKLPMVFNMDSVDALIRKFDQDGNHLDAAFFDHVYYDSFYDMEETADGEFVVTGLSKPQSVCGGNGIFVKIDSNLDTLFVKTYGGPQATGAFFMKIAAFNDTLYSVGTGNIWSPTLAEAHLIKFDEALTFYCQEYDVQLNAVTPTNYELMPSSGTLTNSTQTIPIINSGNIYDIAPLNTYSFCASMGYEDEYVPVEFDLYPNPSNGYVNISVSQSPTEIHIRDLSGRTLKTITNPGVGTHSIDLSDFSSGLYQISILYNGRFYSKKLLLNE